MKPAPDFDARQRSSARQAYVLAGVFYALAYKLCYDSYGAVMGFVVSTPVIGALFSWWLLNRGGGIALYWARWLALRKLDGQHHAFQDMPVRVQWRSGQCWVRARDVFQVVSEEPDDLALRRLVIRFGAAQFFVDENGEGWFGEAAVVQWLEPRAQRLDLVAQKFLLWLQREVFPPMHRKVELQSSPPAV